MDASLQLPQQLSPHASENGSSALASTNQPAAKGPLLGSLLMHALVIGGLYWAGQQAELITPPKIIEVVLFEQASAPEALPAQAEPAVTPPKPLPTPTAAPKVAAPQPVAPPVRPSTPAASTKPVTPNTPLADINTGTVANPPASVAPAVAPAQAASNDNAEVKPRVPDVAASTEVSPARVDARYASTNPRPQYPNMARRLGQEGTVSLEVIVSAEGTAKSVKILESSGFELLDQAALQAISKWRFVPAKRGETPIEQKLTTRWTYKLQE